MSNAQSTAIVPAAGGQIVRADSVSMPAMSIDQAIERHNTMVVYVQKLMKPGIDFGAIPGTDKPTLLKAGAEKLATLFGLTPKPTIVEKTEDWTGKDHGGEPFFYYHYRIGLYRGDVLFAEGEGSANSWEKKHRYRWVRESELPPGADPAKFVRRASTASEPQFAIDKRETGGKYGKPAAYWDKFARAIADGTARKVQRPKKNGGTMEAWEIADVAYRVPNDDVADAVNTLQKMAYKRAMVAATLLAVNASEFFTQDVEDMEVIEADWAPVPPPEYARPPQQQQPPARDESHVAGFLAEWDALVDGYGADRPVGRQVIRLVAQKKKVDTFRVDDFRVPVDAAGAKVLLDAFRVATAEQVGKLIDLVAAGEKSGAAAEPPPAAPDVEAQVEE